MSLSRKFPLLLPAPESVPGILNSPKPAAMLTDFARNRANQIHHHHDALGFRLAVD
jgi:hypothetical protein